MAEKTVSLALLGRDHRPRARTSPGTRRSTAGAPALALSALMGAVLYRWPDAAARRRARGRDPARHALVYLALLRRCVPDGFGLLMRPLRHDLPPCSTPCHRRELMWARTAVVRDRARARGRGCRDVAAAGGARAAGREVLDQPPHLLRGAGRPDADRGQPAAPVRDAGPRARRLRARPALYVRGGTYRERDQGAASRRAAGTRACCVRNFPGERPVVSGQLWIGEPQLLDDPRDQRHLGRRQPERADRAHLRRHRLAADRAPRSGARTRPRACRSTTARATTWAAGW